MKNLLVNPKVMLEKAKKGNYAVAHFNFNSLNEIKGILKGANKINAPIMLAITESSLNSLQLSYKSLVSIINDLIKNLEIKIPVALHLDHCQNVEEVIKAIDAGFSSVMYDGSHIAFEKNYENTKKIVAYAKKFNVACEAEIGKIGGKEDNIVNAQGELADVEEAKKIAGLDITMLAAGIGNIHGVYPSNWKGLSFETLENIKNNVNLPLVMHGGSGIPNYQVLKAIKMGICKFNVGTQIQIIQNEALRKYYETKQDKNKKGFDIRKIMVPVEKAIEDKVIEMIKLFGSNNKA